MVTSPNKLSTNPYEELTAERRIAKLKKLRVLLGIKQIEVGPTMGRDERWLSQIETNREYLSAELALEIHLALRKIAEKRLKHLKLLL